MVNRELIKSKELEIKKLRKEVIVPKSDMIDEISDFLLKKGFRLKPHRSCIINFYSDELKFNVGMTSYYGVSGKCGITFRDDNFERLVDDTLVWNSKKTEFGDFLIKTIEKICNL